MTCGKCRTRLRIQYSNKRTHLGNGNAIMQSQKKSWPDIRLFPFPVNPTNPQVVEIGKFAVKEHNEQAGTDLEFVKVAGGIKWDIMAATFYTLGMKVKSSTDTKIQKGKVQVVEAVTGDTLLPIRARHYDSSYSITGDSNKPPSDRDRKICSERGQRESRNRSGVVNVFIGIKWNVFLATFYVLGIKLKRSTDGKIHLRDAKVVEAVTGHKKLLSWE
ncbi:hypothetical protein ACH5RR_017496 [Cinchona calisaya]|uniref:Cystatin domain-containing protein n=1 Tax=Cinchona calisaya TaxID=153742 RepID=A0ABD2ZMI9_9GENT